MDKVFQSLSNKQADYVDEHTSTASEVVRKAAGKAAGCDSIQHGTLKALNRQLDLCLTCAC